MSGLFALILTSTGAIFFWLTKKMKVPLNQEMNGRFDRDFKYFRNLVVGLVIFFSSLLLANYLVKTL